MEEQVASVNGLQQEFDLLLDTILLWSLSERVEAPRPVSDRDEVASLLADMDYSFDERAAARAERKIARRVSECRKVLL